MTLDARSTFSSVPHRTDVISHASGATDAGWPRSNRCAGQLFGFSILYLFLLFAAIAGERLVAIFALTMPW
jgi:heme O synthase-like polyprenyltransferase